MALSRRRKGKCEFSTLLLAHRLVACFSEQPSSLAAALLEQSLSVTISLGDPKRLMALLHVDDQWRSGLCSSGQKTRLQLVLQLAPRADVRVLDELTRDLDALARHRVLAFLEKDAATCLYATHVFQGLDGWATDVLRVRRGACSVEEASSVDVAGVLLSGLRNDADLPPPPPAPPSPKETAPTTSLPAGWASRRANTLEGGFGAHGWTTASAVGAEHAGEISTAHQAFADLYESGGKR